MSESRTAEWPAVIADIGQGALLESDLAELMQLAMRRTAEALDVALVHLLRLLPGGDDLVIEASHGQCPAQSSPAVIEGGRRSHAGYALEVGVPVVVEDYREEQRFEVPRQLIDQGVLSGMTVVVQGRDCAYGVVCAHDVRPRPFRRSEVSFLQAVASILGAAVENQRAMAALRKSEEHLRASEERYRRLQLDHTQLERVAVAGEFAGVVAHEIRTPLNALSINAQMLGRLLRRGRSEDRERGEHLLQTLRDEIERINGLLEEYLKILRPRQRRDRVFDINRTVEDAIRFVEPKAAGSGVAIARDLCAEPPRACADEEALRQVLLNILVNAIEAMPDGGQVEVTTRRRADGVLLRVRDNGPGLAEEIRERVFHPFVSTKREGTGLGLAISQRLTSEMDGEIVVSSEPGQGACFEVLLPVTRLR